VSNIRTLADITNPELLPLLKEMDPRGTLVPFSIEAKRGSYRAALYRSGEPEPVASSADRIVPSPAAEIPVRIYHPRLNRSSSLPAIVYMHGGGFISGNLETHDAVCRMLSNHVPAVVVAVDYRLAPENPYPAALDDCYAVLQWVHENATSIKADPKRIAVAGDSAGGNLAAVTALLARDERGGPPLRAQVLIYPMLDATLTSPSLVENAFIPPFTLVDCVYSWQLYVPKAVNRLDPEVSPLYTPLAGLPPALILTGTLDILSDEGARYAEYLRCSGVHAEHESFAGMIHGFFLWGGVVAAARVAMNRVVQFLQHQLA
jgi:acetyl esterase